MRGEKAKSPSGKRLQMLPNRGPVYVEVILQITSNKLPLTVCSMQGLHLHIMERVKVNFPMEERPCVMEWPGKWFPGSFCSGHSTSKNKLYAPTR